MQHLRERQVERTMGPVTRRVLAWARRLGLDQYEEVRYGDHFMPERLVAAGPVRGRSFRPARASVSPARNSM